MKIGLPINKSINKTATTALALIISLSSPWALADENVLPTITVKEKSEQESTGYQSGTTNIGKSTQAAKDIPQSLTIVNRNLIDDQNATSLHDALRNVAGLTFNAGEGGRVGDNITIRGFGASSDLYLDGMRDNSQYNRDTFNIEQVEALRGAASMLFGRGSTGGVINQVSKEPELGKTSNISAIVGSHNYFRETADVNQETGASSAFRINLMKTDSESHRDAVTQNSFGIAPSFKWGIDTQNEFLLAYSHLQYDNVPDYGIPIRSGQGNKPAAVSYDNFYGLASDYQQDSADVYTGRWTHKFDDNNQLKTTIRHNNVDRDLRATAPRFASANNNIINRQIQARGAIEKTTALQSDYTSKFQALNMKHETLLGAEYLYETADRWTNFSPTANPTTDLNNPNPYDNFNGSFTHINPIEFKDNNLGIYGQDLIEFIPHWKLLFGGRYDDFQANYKSTTTSTGAVTRYDRSDKVLSYRTGLMFQPSDYSTYYASYGTSFNPSGDLYSVEAISGANIGKVNKTDPEKSINMEVGAKWELFDGNLSLRTAIFRSEKTNERNTDQAATDVFLLSGRRHTDGIELEANGKLTKNWEIFTSLALMKGRIDRHTNPTAIGLTPPNTPTVSGNVWNTYKINSNWKIGGGANFVGERTGYGVNADNVTAPLVRRVPGYITFDAMTQWTLDQYSVKLNIFNLLNKEYFDSIYQTSGAHAIPGVDRSAQLTFGYKF